MSFPPPSSAAIVCCVMSLLLLATSFPWALIHLLSTQSTTAAARRCRNSLAIAHPSRGRSPRRHDAACLHSTRRRMSLASSSSLLLLKSTRFWRAPTQIWPNQALWVSPNTLGWIVLSRNGRRRVTRSVITLVYCSL